MFHNGLIGLQECFKNYIRLVCNLFRSVNARVDHGHYTLQDKPIITSVLRNMRDETFS